MFLQFKEATSENTVILFVCPPKFFITLFPVSLGTLQWSQEKTKTMIMQNSGGQTRTLWFISEVAFSLLTADGN